MSHEPVALVAIGASAGGLEPLEAFFQAVPERTGIAYVVIQHLSPDYRSMMNELLGRKSSMRICHIEDGMQPEPNTVYLNRPGMYVTLHNETFRTEAYQPEQDLPHLPIDRMFISLAQRDPNRTIGIVLSGSGSDGAKGAQTLHLAGTAVLVQSLGEAGFPSMPRAVLTLGCVDQVLDAGQMPAAVQDILAFGKTPVEFNGDSNTAALQTILRRIESLHKVNFTHYRQANVKRRIMRRLHLRGHAGLEDYANVLSHSDEAVRQLFEDMLIGVTSFYRDREAVGVLRQEALVRMIENTTTAAPLKIWVPACATGEEVYTIAIETNEALRAAGSMRAFRIIGTDVHAKSIDVASRGVYSAEQLSSIPTQLRDQYFQQQGDSFVVDPILRQKIIFSVHDVLADPPFMNLDLISCRNLLIYLREEPQANVISMFLFGLKPEGYLFLGASETVGRYAAAFQTVDPRWRLFRKRAEATGSARALFARRGVSSTPAQTAALQPDVLGQRKPFLSEVNEVRSRDVMIRAYDALLKRYAPSSILISAEGQVLTWFGAAGLVIDTLNNLADWTVQDIVHPDLHFPISVGIEKLRLGEDETHVRQVQLTLADGEDRDVRVEIEPLPAGTQTRLLLVKLDLTLPQLDQPRQITDDATDADILTQRVHAMERDLRLTEQTLQHVTERLEASGEELQASNEELQASNEELQASNEELQSSNEELHAVNEELVSVTAEHERKIALLSELNSSTEVVLKTLNTGVIVVDNGGAIRRFSQLIERDFMLHDHDVGRSLSVVGPRLDFADLTDMVEQVNRNPTPLTKMGTHDGRGLRVEARRIPLNADIGGRSGVMLLFRWQ